MCVCTVSRRGGSYSTSTQLMKSKRVVSLVYLCTCSPHVRCVGDTTSFFAFSSLALARKCTRATFIAQRRRPLVSVAALLSTSSTMLQLFSLSPALVVSTVAPAPAVQIVQQRAAMLVEPSLPTPFLIAKEGIPKVQYDYTRGLDELNGIDVWADIPTTSEVNRAKGTDRVYQRTVKQNLAPAEKAPIDEPGYKSIREEIEEDRLKLAAKTAAAKAARAAKN